MLNVQCGPDERAPFHRATDNAPMAHSRLVLVCLRRCAAEGTPVRGVHHRRVESELRPTVPRGPRQDHAPRNFCIQAGHGAVFSEDHCDCGAERIWKCCLIQRSEKMCPQASSVAGRRDRHFHLEQSKWFAIPPSTHISSKQRTNLSELPSMHAKRFGKRDGGRPSDAYVVLLVGCAFVVIAPFVSCSAICNRCCLLEEDCDIIHLI